MEWSTEGGSRGMRRRERGARRVSCITRPYRGFERIKVTMPEPLDLAAAELELSKCAGSNRTSAADWTQKYGAALLAVAKAQRAALAALITANDAAPMPAGFLYDHDCSIVNSGVCECAVGPWAAVMWLAWEDAERALTLTSAEPGDKETK